MAVSKIYNREKKKISQIFVKDRKTTISLSMLIRKCLKGTNVNYNSLSKCFFKIMSTGVR